jgi:3-hydroxybutyryl-CoA dehydrogenase
MIQHIAVIGAGTMGHGIAYAAAAAGFRTTLFDVAPAALDRARTSIERIAGAARDRGLLDADGVQRLLARLECSSDLSAAVHAADFVIEATPEQLDLKMAVLADIETHAPAAAVIATNTSALSITEIAATLKQPARVGGMHFFNPVQKMKLVEIVRGLESAPSTLQAIEDVATTMGKETVLVRESPGFVTSRVNASIGNEAFYMLLEGVASARDIDKALKLGLNHPMGPFELVDLVGLDTRLSILQYLQASLGEKYRPCPLLVQYVKAGRLGRKVGRGVYEY